VAIITVSAVDSEGRVVPTASNEVSFTVSDNATILGVGNGDSTSHEPDKATRRRVFNGLAQVIIQATPEAEQITLSANSPGLLPAHLIIEAEQTPCRPHVPAC